MSKRQRGWAAAFFSGAGGWYLTLASAKVFPAIGIWWVELIIALGCLGLLVYCSTTVIRDMDEIVGRLARPGDGLRLDKIRKREEQLARWLMVPMLIWWFPILFAISAAGNW